MNKFWLTLAVGLLGFGAIPAYSAEPLIVPARADLSWTLPTETECLDPAATDPATCAKLPLTASLALSGIALFVAPAPIPDNGCIDGGTDPATCTQIAPVAVLAGNATSAVYNATVGAGSTLYFRVKARNNYALSKFSPQVSKVVDVPNVAPGAPTNVTVEFKIGVVPTP
jgi:hypothetical protein